MQAPEVEEQSTDEQEQTHNPEEQSEALETSETDESVMENIENQPEISIEASQLKAAQELGIENLSAKSDTEIAEEIVDKIEKSDDPKGVLSRMPGVRSFVKAAILTLGLSMSSGIFEKSYAADDAQSSKPDTTQVDAGGNTEEERSVIKLYQMEVNDMLDNISEKFYGKVDIPNEQLFDFQQKAWDWAEYVVDNKGSRTDFLQGVKQLYEESFAEQIAALQEMQREKALALAAEIADEEISLEDINEDWLWENVDKVFRSGTSVYMVKADSSRDMQMSLDKATLSARAEMVKVLKEHNSEAGSTLFGSKVVKRGIRKSGNLYEGVIILELPVDKNIK